jgi:hypothetical protein
MLLMVLLFLLLLLMMLKIEHSVIRSGHLITTYSAIFGGQKLF